MKGQGQRNVFRSSAELTEILEDEIQPLVTMDDVHELDDGGMIELLEQGNLSNRRRRNSLHISVQPDLL